MRGEIALSMNVIGKLDNTVIDAMGIDVYKRQGRRYCGIAER